MFSQITFHVHTTIYTQRQNTQYTLNRTHIMYTIYEIIYHYMKSTLYVQSTDSSNAQCWWEVGQGCCAIWWSEWHTDMNMISSPESSRINKVSEVLHVKNFQKVDFRSRICYTQTDLRVWLLAVSFCVYNSCDWMITVRRVFFTRQIRAVICSKVLAGGFTY